MKRSQVFPSRYLSKDDVENPATAVITDVRLETIKGDHGDEDRPVMFFQGDLKPMIVNNTNWMACEDAYGDDSDNWRGKQVEIYVDPGVMFGGKRVGGVRIRIPNNGNGGHMTLDEAVAACAEVDINKDALVEHLKSKGNTGWNSVRDTPIVKLLIEQAKAAADEIPY